MEQKKPEELSKDQKDNALTEVPSILEVCSQSFFIGGYFVGPQFSMRKFQNFIQRNINEDLPPSRRFAFKRFGIGLCYLLGHLLGDKFIAPVEFVETPEFANLGFLKKTLFFCLKGQSFCQVWPTMGVGKMAASSGMGVPMFACAFLKSLPRCSISLTVSISTQMHGL